MIHPAPSALMTETLRIMALKIWIWSGLEGAERTAMLPLCLAQVRKMGVDP